MAGPSWFGGAARNVEVPVGARLLHSDPPLWTCGGFPARIATRGPYSVAVFGTCGVSDDLLESLVEKGFSDSDLIAWPGTYTLVSISPTSIEVLTDPAGAQPIYVTSFADSIVWGSSSLALAGLNQSDVDESWLRGHLARKSLVGLEFPSSFLSVRQKAAGQRLSFGIDGSTSSRTAWSPLASARSLDETVARLRDSLSAGVALRVADLDVVTADCSGGLDSTTLCLLADPSRVIAINVQPHDVHTGGDLDFVAAVQRDYPMLRRRRILVGDEDLPYSSMDNLPPTDAPPRSAVVAGRFSTWTSVLRNLGSQLHFTGDGADALLIPPLHYLRDLLDSGHPLRAWRELLGWAHLRRASPWSLWRETRYPQDEASRSAAHLPPTRMTANDLVLQAVRANAIGAASDHQLATFHGVRSALPFLDNQVVDAVLGLPASAHASPHDYKPLLTKAFASLLPAEVATRRTKATFLADHYRGIRANLPALLDLADGELAARGLVDPLALGASLKTAASGVGVDLGPIEAAISAEAWLRAIRRTPSVPWERTS